MWTLPVSPVVGGFCILYIVHTIISDYKRLLELFLVAGCTVSYQTMPRNDIKYIYCYNTVDTKTRTKKDNTDNNDDDK